jgi:hypothetical protein
MRQGCEGQRHESYGPLCATLTTALPAPFPEMLVSMPTSQAHVISSPEARTSGHRVGDGRQRGAWAAPLIVSGPESGDALRSSPLGGLVSSTKRQA